MIPRSKSFGKLSTLSRTEKDDREAERLVQNSPKKKPPRNDLRRNTPRDEEKDPDKEQDRKDRSNNYKDAHLAIRVAMLWLVADTRKEDLITVRRKQDGKPVQVLEETFRSSPDLYEEIQEDEIGEDSPTEESPKEDPLEKTRKDLLQKYIDLGLDEALVTKQLEDLKSDNAEALEKNLIEEANKSENMLKMKGGPAALQRRLKKEFQDQGVPEEEVQETLELVGQENLEPSELDEILDVLRSKAKKITQVKKVVDSLLEKGVRTPSSLKNFQEQVTELYKESLEAKEIEKVLKSIKAGSPKEDLEGVFRKLDKKVENATKAQKLEEQVTELYKDSLDAKEIEKVLKSIEAGSPNEDLEEVFRKLDKKVKAKKLEEEKKKQSEDPFYDPDDPIPPDSKEEPGEEEAEQALARSEKTVSKYRNMSKEVRQSHMEQILDDMEDLPEGSPRRMHLDAIRKGIGVAAALTDGAEAKGVGGSVAKLISVADKAGKLRDILSLGAFGGGSSGGDPVEESRRDQEIIRDIFRNVDDNDWEDLLPEDHPGRGLAELLGPGGGMYLSEKDREPIRQILEDLMVGEIEILDSEIDEQIDPQATRREREEAARAARGSRSTQRPDFRDPSSAKSWLLDFLKDLAEKASSRIKEFLGGRS